MAMYDSSDYAISNWVYMYDKDKVCETCNRAGQPACRPVADNSCYRERATGVIVLYAFISAILFTGTLIAIYVSI
jgi:hypothetical protein